MTNKNFKSGLKDIVIGALAAGKLPAQIQSLLSKKSISIFTYHAVIDTPLSYEDWCFLDSDTFSQQMAYLNDHFHVVSLTDACKMITEDTIDRPTAVITFDDGYLNNATVALPILQQYNFPFTIYLATELINTISSVWFTRIHQAIADTQLRSLNWQGDVFSLQTNSEKLHCSRSIQEWFKTLHPSDIERNIHLFRDALELSAVAETTAPAFAMLSKSDITTLVNTGLVEFGAHTAEHTILSRLTRDEQQHQISRSIEAVSKLTGKECLHFAYPNGSGNDFNEDSVDILTEMGVLSATTMIKGKATNSSDLFRLPRYPVGADTDFNRFKLMSHHIS